MSSFFHNENRIEKKPNSFSKMQGIAVEPKHKQNTKQ